MLQYQTFIFFAQRFGGAKHRLVWENGLAARGAARQKEVRILCDF
jgi:hypothetical protein